jgi:hypothetical protein
MLRTGVYATLTGKQLTGFVYGITCQSHICLGDFSATAPGVTANKLAPRCARKAFP